jgi:outer membrane protein
VQYIHYFDGGHSDLGGAKISLDDSWGFALQGGVDVEIGKGWYLNADIKKVWLDTDASWQGTAAKADVTVDPLIASVGIGYRFNLADLLGPRAEPAPLK